MAEQVNQSIGSINVLVESYDKAIEFYTKKLQFDLIEDVDMGSGIRWIQVAPPNSKGSAILLSKADTEAQRLAIGKQSGDAVFLILHSDNFWRDYARMKAANVVFNEEPREEPYGTVVIFQDLYGNKWDLIQPNHN